MALVRKPRSTVDPVSRSAALVEIILQIMIIDVDHAGFGDQVISRSRSPGEKGGEVKRVVCSLGTSGLTNSQFVRVG